MPYLSPILNQPRSVEPIPFPLHVAQAMTATRPSEPDPQVMWQRALPDRRMHVLADQLDCLGYFDPHPDGPHAA